MASPIFFSNCPMFSAKDRIVLMIQQTLDGRRQHRKASLRSRLPDTGGASRAPLRNGPSVRQPRPAPPISRCFVRAKRCINRSG